MKKPMILIILSTPLCIILLLLISYLAKILDIEIIGGGQLWLTTTATLLSGTFTLVGVFLTLEHTKKETAENNRLLNMPLLKYSISYSTLMDFDKSIFTLSEDFISTSSFPDIPTKEYPILNITLSNSNSAFNVKILDAITCNSLKDRDTSSNNPCEEYLLPHESLKSMIHYSSYQQNSKSLNNLSNIFGIIRVSYEDILKNVYYQDLPVIFSELTPDKQLLELRTIKQPQLLKNYIPLEDVLTYIIF